MGATIHAHIEVKRNGQWLHFAAPNVARDYVLFAAISGERIENFSPLEQEVIKPCASVKGLPKDLSEVTRFCYEQDKAGCRLHGEGALEANDIWDLQDHINRLSILFERENEPHDLDLDIFHTLINGNSIVQHQGWDDVRIVFWYDN